MISQFQELLAELGRVFHLELRIDQSSACSILVAPQLVIQLQLDSSQERLFLFCKIAEIPPGKFRENILMEGLKANALPDPLPGILAYLAQTNHLVLYQNYPLAILNGERLASFFTNFAKMADNWQKALLSGQSAPNPTTPVPTQKPFGLKP
jgi:Tir chaperone family protein CesT